MTNIWTILEIDPTKDETEIKAAYLKKMPSVHPEEDPEGFIALRAAYDEALRLAKEEALPETSDKSETGLIMTELKALYNDFLRRCDLDEWKKILEQDICYRIDLQQKLNYKLLTFLMENDDIPHYVWAYLGTFFSWEDYKAQLNDDFPPGFVRYIINNRDKEDSIRYNLFTDQGDKDYKGFLSACFSMNQTLFELNNTEEIKEKIPPYIEKADSFGVVHVDFEVLRLKFYRFIEDKEKMAAQIEVVSGLLGNDKRILFEIANCCLFLEKNEEALALFKKLAEDNSDADWAKTGIANAYMALGNFEEARLILIDQVREAPHNGYLRARFDECISALIPLHVDYLKENPDDEDRIYKLASCYYNDEQLDKCVALIGEFTPTTEEFKKRHYSILSSAYARIDEKEKALEHIKIWEEIEDDKKDLAISVPNLLFNLGEYQEALEKCDFYLELFPDNRGVLEFKVFSLHKLEKLEEALALIDDALSLYFDDYVFHMEKAEISYEMNNYSQVIQSSNLALDFHPYLLNMYVLQMKVFFEVDQYEDVLNVITTMKEKEFDIPEMALYGAASEISNGNDTEKNLSVITDFLDNYPANEMAVSFIDDYFYDRNQMDKFEYYIDRAIEADPAHVGFKYYRVRMYRFTGNADAGFADLEWIKNHAVAETPHFYNEYGLMYALVEKKEKAIECYLKAIELDEQNGRAYGLLGGAYSDLEEHQKAADAFTSQLEIRPHPYYFVSRGIEYGKLKETEKEQADYLSAIEMDPNYDSAYNNYGITLFVLKKYEDAVPYFNKAIELEPDSLYSYAYLADIYEKFQNLNLAIEILDKGLEFYNGVNKGKYRHLVHIKMRKLLIANRNQAVISAGEAALALDVESPAILRRIGMAYFELGEDSKAKTYLIDKALKKYADDYYVHIDVAKYYAFAVKSASKVKKHLEAAIKIDPNDSRAFLTFGDCLEFLGKKKAAKQYYQKALNLLLKADNNSPCNLYDIGNCYRGMGELSKAEAYLKRAEKEAPEFGECVKPACYDAIFKRGLLALEKGEIQKGLALLDKAIEISPDRDYIEWRKKILKKNKING